MMRTILRCLAFSLGLAVMALAGVIFIVAGTSDLWWALMIGTALGMGAGVLGLGISLWALGWYP